MSNDMSNAAPGPLPAELAEQQGVGNLPRPLEDLRDATQHVIDCADGGDDYACGRPMIEAMTALGIMEKTGRGLWSTNVQVARAVVDALAATGKQKAGAFPWENLPSYLIDKCEGDTISEESLQRAVADMAKDARYCPPQQAGEVQGDNRSPNEMADALERIAGGGLADYEGVDADELHMLRCAKLIRDLAARSVTLATVKPQRNRRTRLREDV